MILSVFILFSISFPDYTLSCNLNGSWEKIQVKLLEKCICASLKMGIFLYSMLMFWKNDAEGTVIWVLKYNPYLSMGSRLELSSLFELL